MKITKELIEEMVREALNERTEQQPKEKTSGDVDRILTPADMKLINTNPEFVEAIKKLLQHTENIPQGVIVLRNLYKQLPDIIKKTK